MNTIKNICFENLSVLIRVDFNVPLDKSLTILDDNRMLQALPTIKKVLRDGGRVILMSHLGRPKNGFENCFSLKHLVLPLSKLLNVSVLFSPDCVGETAIKMVKKLSSGEVLLLENLRFYKEEKAGDPFFAKQLSQLGDVYINDAFGTAHRKHASTSVIAKYFSKKKYFGCLFSAEITALNRALKAPQKPFTAIIGGAKISGKIDVIKKLLNQVDNLIIGGGMAYTFIKAQGGSIGDSLVEQDKINLAQSLINDAKVRGVNLLLPVDSLNADSFNNNASTYCSDISNIKNGFLGLDIGEKSIALFSKAILESKTIIWNGPMGVFEMEKFKKGTQQIASAIVNATKKGAFSLVGGGDSVSALKKFSLLNDVSYVSTGGGAMLKYVEGSNLPAITAITT